MMEREAEFFTLQEAADRMNRSQNDLLRMAAAGGLTMTVFYDGLYRILGRVPKEHTFDIDDRPPYSGLLLVDSGTAIELLTNERCFRGGFYSYSDEMTRGKQIDLLDHRGNIRKKSITREDILIPAASVAVQLETNLHEPENKADIFELLQPWRTTDEFDQAFEKAVRLQEIEKDIALITSSPAQDLAKFKYKDDLIAIKKEADEIRAWLNVRSAKNDLKKSTPERIESKTPLNQAIEKLYRYYHNKGEYDVLMVDRVDDFIRKLDEIIKRDRNPGTEGNIEPSNYVLERIGNITIKKNGTVKITTTSMELDGPSGSKIRHDQKSYDKMPVTKKLCSLRKKYPIPEQIPVPHP